MAEFVAVAVVVVLSILWALRLLRKQHSGRDGGGPDAQSHGGAEAPTGGESRAATEIAGRVTDRSQLRALERRADAARERAQFSDRRRDDAEAERLEAAAEIAAERLTRYQYLPHLGLLTPLLAAEHSHNAYYREEAQRVRERIGGTDREWWTVSSDSRDRLQRRPKSLDGLIAFRKIVESDRTPREKLRDIQALAESDQTFARAYFSTAKSAPSYAEQWALVHLRAEGLPVPQLLVAHGCLCPEECLTLDATEFARWKGVGPKAVSVLVDWQAKKATPK